MKKNFINCLFDPKSLFILKPVQIVYINGKEYLTKGGLTVYQVNITGGVSVFTR